MRKAITTKYFGPTNCRGSRIQASANGVRPIYSPRGSGSIDNEHAKAAKALAEKYDWTGLWIAGGKPDETGNVYVCSGDRMPLEYAAAYFGKGGEDWFFVEA